jgi:small membrane protein
VTTFQVVTLPLLAVVVLVIAIQTARRRLTARVGFAWIALWVAAAVSIADPDLLVRAAHFLGIGRGADLVLYLSVIFSFAAFFVTYLRFRRVDEQLTKLVRHIAIRDAGAPPRG